MGDAFLAESVHILSTFTESFHPEWLLGYLCQRNTYHPPKHCSYWRSRSNQTSCPNARLGLQAGLCYTKQVKERGACCELSSIRGYCLLHSINFDTCYFYSLRWICPFRLKQRGAMKEAAQLATLWGVASPAPWGQLSATAVSSTDSAVCRTIHCSVPSAQPRSKTCLLNQVSQQ